VRVDKQANVHPLDSVTPLLLSLSLHIDRVTVSQQQLAMAACTSCNEPTNLNRDGTPLPTPYAGIGSDLGLCRGCRSFRQMDIWAAAPDWNTLLQLNLLFIRGEVDVSPSYPPLLKAETTPLVSGLVKLHEYGILTTRSQPSRDASGFITGLGWVEERERPYLYFELPTLHPEIPIDKVDTFVQRLFDDRELLVSAYSECDLYVKTEASTRMSRVAPKAGGRETYHFRTNASWTQETVAKSRVAETSKGLANEEWAIHTSFPFTSVAAVLPTAMLCGSGKHCNNFEAAEAMRPLAICIIGKSWDLDLNLQEIIRGHCEGAGLARVLDVESRIGRRHLNFDGQGGSGCVG